MAGAVDHGFLYTTANKHVVQTRTNRNKTHRLFDGTPRNLKHPNQGAAARCRVLMPLLAAAGQRYAWSCLLNCSTYCGSSIAGL